MSKSIVVADDDPDILSIVAMSLETQGYDVYKATNGREAVDLVCDHHPDLIILDMMMPVMSGYEAIAELKADDTPAPSHRRPLAKAMATDMERATTSASTATSPSPSASPSCCRSSRATSRVTLRAARRSAPSPEARAIDSSSSVNCDKNR